VRVNSTHAEVIQTDMRRSDLCQPRNLGTNHSNAARDGWHASDRRLGTPNDIAEGVVFLSTHDAAFMIGAGFVVMAGRLRNKAGSK